MTLTWKWTWLAVTLVIAACSKKEAPETESAPKTDSAEVAQAQPREDKKEEAAPGEGALRARFDGYSRRVAGSLWQTVSVTDQPAQYALLVPTAPVPASITALSSTGPENIAVGTQGLLMETGEPRPLVVGREYDFVFTRAEGAGVWSVAITRAP